MAQAGARFEAYVRKAMDEAELSTLAELYRASGVAASTWSGWFRGVSAPRRNSMVLAGQALNKTPEQLLAAWDGERPHKARRATETTDPLVNALRDQTAEMARLTAELALGRIDQQEATDALLRAMATLVREPGGTSADSERDAPVDIPR